MDCITEGVANMDLDGINSLNKAIGNLSIVTEEDIQARILEIWKETYSISFYDEVVTMSNTINGFTTKHISRVHNHGRMVVYFRSLLDRLNTLKNDMNNIHRFVDLLYKLTQRVDVNPFLNAELTKVYTGLKKHVDANF